MRGLLTIACVQLLLVASAWAADPGPAVTSNPAHVVTNPSWSKIPDWRDLERFWPAKAKGVSGFARIRCLVTSRGLLDQCKVISETPEGDGFGSAALLLAPLFVMKPRTVDGVPVGGSVVVVPIRFQSNGVPPASQQSVRVANNLPWAAAPTAAMVAAAFPSRAVGHAVTGHVVLRCDISKDGSLYGCETATEEPSGLDFSKAAHGLAKEFRVLNDPALMEQLHKAEVDVPFDFRDPSQPSLPPEITEPQWLQGADPKMAGRLFPEAAAKAGFKTGIGTVSCQVDHGGALINCRVVKETPEGLGFGVSALAIADVMRMNPWTKQGLPVDGAHVNVPIRINLTQESAPASPTAQPQ